MNRKKLLLSSLVLLLFISSFAQKNKVFQLASPNGKVNLQIEIGAKTSWTIKHGQTAIIAPSDVSMTLANGEILGADAVVNTNKTESVNSNINANFYKKKIIVDNYNQLTLQFKNGYGLIFRAYNDGAAYRFFTSRRDSLTIQSEQVNFNFDKDYTCHIPYVRDLRGKEQYINSFEALYDELPISKCYKDSLAFLPMLVNLDNGKKVAIVESDLEDYPGMFIASKTNGFSGSFAPYPLAVYQGGYSMLNTMVSQRADYIAKTKGTRNFPWRAVVISENDKDLANSDMVQKLAAPSRVSDITWIKPGKVSWDWWNDWNITHVDFKAGINTPTYKYYIDFAAANKLEYIIMDEGWSEILDLMKISDKINLQELIDYGKQKNVGVILWASWYSVQKDLNKAFDKYAAMGVKGFKIDFMDRDDQVMVSSLYAIAKKAAENKLFLDFHGMYKPTGLQRTFPNILNFEGVKGMENCKWTPNDDVPRYDATIPFIRMVAGPMDYTPGAMRNATKLNFRPSNSLPMSQGTRCHQMAMYTVFEAPLQMLADNPTVYMKEQECTDFIAKVPTVFDETIALDGKVGQYIALARKSGNIWFVGAMGNWDERDSEIDFSFLGEGKFKAEIFKDGINADKDATDYKKEIINVVSSDKLKIHLSNGGGWTARIEKTR